MPNDPNIALIAQASLCAAKGKYVEAIAFYEQCSLPQDCVVHYANVCYRVALESTDERCAIEFYERAISQNHTASMIARAKIFLRDRDYANAIGLYERAIALGDSDAMLARAKMHEESINLRKDPARTGLSKVTRL